MTMDVQIIEDNGSNHRVELSAVGQVSTSEADRSQEPYQGMTFESEEAARAYYDEYAGRAGFMTRVLSSRKSERDGSIISRGLCCRGIQGNQRSGSSGHQKGDRRRDGCTAMILVKREKPGTWVVRKFVRDHNHPLVISPSKRRPTFDVKDKKIQELTAEIRIKKRLSALYRQQLLNLMQDVESHSEHLSTKIHAARSTLKDLEAKRQELSNQSRHHK